MRAKFLRATWQGRAAPFTLSEVLAEPAPTQAEPPRSQLEVSVQAAFQYVTLIGGQLLALLVLLVLQSVMTRDEISAWGWRIPFFIGALAALVALYLRSALPETANASIRAKKESGTFNELMKHKRALLTVIGFTAGGSLAFYTYTTYMQKYLVNTAGMKTETASVVMTCALVVYMLMQPLFGALSDRIGRRNHMLAFGMLVMLSTVPLLTNGDHDASHEKERRSGHRRGFAHVVLALGASL